MTSTKQSCPDKNTNASVPIGSEASLFSNHPNLLFRDAYPNAKLRKILGLQTIYDHKIIYIRLEISLFE